MSLEDLTDSIVQLCQECNIWSSTINIPHGNGDILDISAACGSQACAHGCCSFFGSWCLRGIGTCAPGCCQGGWCRLGYPPAGRNSLLDGALLLSSRSSYLAMGSLNPCHGVDDGRRANSKWERGVFKQWIWIGMDQYVLCSVNLPI